MNKCNSIVNGYLGELVFIFRSLNWREFWISVHKVRTFIEIDRLCCFNYGLMFVALSRVSLRSRHK